MVSSNVSIIIICALLIITICSITIGLFAKDDRAHELHEKVLKHDTDGFVKLTPLMQKISNNSIVNKAGNLGNIEGLGKLFNDSKNPWNITPVIFTAARFLGLSAGIVIAVLSYLLIPQKAFAIFGVFFGIICFVYPKYYYQAIAKEREDEWDKVYEFIWLIKNSTQLFDAKKVWLETQKYISVHYPQYKELNQGFEDFAKHWNTEEVPDYIIKYYSFPIPKELYNIIFNMSVTGSDATQNLNNLRNFALNKHNGSVQKVLSGVPSKATLASLPFLMASIIVALMVPMILSFMKVM